MPFNTDFRPDKFSEFIGNRSTISSLEALLNKPNHSRSFMFIGPPGCGKTTLARITADIVNCSGMGLNEINCSEKRKIEDAREIIRRSQFKPLNNGNLGWILDEFHLFGEGGNSPKNKPQNALLKIIEEPPKHVFFFICTTNPEDVLATIRSRCTKFELSTLTKKQILELLSRASYTVGVKIPNDVAEQIAADSQGHPRDALTILEKIYNLPEREMLRAAKQNSVKENSVVDLCQALLKSEPWKEIVTILDSLQSEDTERIRKAVLEYFAKVMRTSPDRSYLIMDSFRRPFFETGRPGLYMACYESVMK